MRKRDPEYIQTVNIVCESGCTRLEIKNEYGDSTLRFDFACVRAADYESKKSLFEKVGLTVPSREEAMIRSKDDYDCYRLVFRGDEDISKAAGVFLNSPYKYFLEKNSDIAVWEHVAGIPSEEQTPEWRPWNQKEFSAGFRAATRTLCILAKAQQKLQQDSSESKGNDTNTDMETKEAAASKKCSLM